MDRTFFTSQCESGFVAVFFLLLRRDPVIIQNAKFANGQGRFAQKDRTKRDIFSKKRTNPQKKDRNSVESCNTQSIGLFTRIITFAKKHIWSGCGFLNAMNKYVLKRSRISNMDFFMEGIHFQFGSF